MAKASSTDVLEEGGAQYEVVAPTYLDRLYDQPGARITYDGIPNKALKPLNAEAEAAVAAAAKARADRPAPNTGLSTTNVPVTADAPKAADLKAMRKRAEDAEFRVAVLEEELAKANAELQAVTDERDALKAGPGPADDTTDGNKPPPEDGSAKE